MTDLNAWTNPDGSQWYYCKGPIFVFRLTKSSSTWPDGMGLLASVEVFLVSDVSAELGSNNIDIHPSTNVQLKASFQGRWDIDAVNTAKDWIEQFHTRLVEAVPHPKLEIHHGPFPPGHVPADHVVLANATQVGGSHYKKVKIEPWDYITANGLGFLEGNAIKYLTRFRSKNGVEDLKKARHYLDKLIEVESAKADSDEGEL
jgi:hypothetical protein